MRIVVDSYAWIEIIIGSEKGRKAKDELAIADEVYTPGTVLAEVARKYVREGMDAQVVLERLRRITKVSGTVGVDVELAVEAAKCYGELSAHSKNMGFEIPSLFDAIVLATARVLGAKVLTGDQHFKNLSDTVWLE